MTYLSLLIREQRSWRAPLSAAKDYVAENGASRLSLQTERHNLTARSLYEQNGYEEDTAFVHYRLSVPAK